MTSNARRLALASLLVAASLASGTARAGDDDLDVSIYADARVETTILTMDKQPIQTCLGDCVVRLPRGRYRLEASGDNVTSKGKRLDLERPVRVDVDPGDKSSRTAGLTIGIGGGAVTVVSIFAAMFARLDTVCFGCDHPKTFDSTPYVIVAGAGLAASAIGWTLFASSGTSMRVTAEEGATSSPPRLAFGIAPTKGGAFGTVGFAF